MLALTPLTAFAAEKTAFSIRQQPTFVAVQEIPENGTETLETRTIQIAVEMPGGFDTVQVALVAEHRRVVSEWIKTDVVMPSGTQLARLNVSLSEEDLSMISRVCLALGPDDRADGYRLLDAHGEKKFSICIERGTAAWSAAAVWGEGRHGGFIFRPRISGGMLE